MTMTYQDHKDLVDAANPTPEIVWYLHVDNTGHDHDDRAVIETELTFLGMRIELECSLDGSGHNFVWATHEVVAEGAYRPAFLSSYYRTWAETKAMAATEWDNVCEIARAHQATEDYARTVLIADDIGDKPPALTGSPIASLAGIAPNPATASHWTLVPEFAADTRHYAFVAASATFLPVLTLGHSGQSVLWEHGTNLYAGVEPTIMLETGENLISITVVSEDQQQARVYTLTVTKEQGD